MPSIRSPILITLATLAAKTVAAPSQPAWPPPFEGTWPSKVVARAPAPAATDVTGQDIGPVDVSYTVDCGCWNLCTLEQAVNTDVVCEQTCDPKYQCDAAPTVTKMKRDVGPLIKRDVVYIIIRDREGRVLAIVAVELR